jgi:hypothetical protein
MNLDLAEREYYVKFAFIDKDKSFRDIKDTSINIKTLVTEYVYMDTQYLV